MNFARMPINFCRKCSLIPLGRTVKMCSQKGLWKKNKKNSRFYSVLEKIHFRITTLYSHSFLNQIQILSNTVILHLKRQSETETRIERVKEREYYNNAPALLFITLYIYKWIGALHRSCFAILWFWLVYIFSPLWF